jgi:hypothetical protein
VLIAVGLAGLAYWINQRRNGSNDSAAYSVMPVENGRLVEMVIAPPVSGHLFTLAGDLDVVQIEAQVAEGDIGKVSSGLVAEFTVASYSDADQHFQGKITDVRLLPVNDRGPSSTR